LKERIIEHARNGMFGSLDVLHLRVFRSSIVTTEGEASNPTKEFSDCLEAAIRRGKHWFLNPFFQRIASAMREGQYLNEAISEEVARSSSKETQEIDSTKNYVKISMDVDILFTNAKEFLEDPSLNVESASVQTDFFRIPL
jgi:hypothetical protein